MNLDHVGSLSIESNEPINVQPMVVELSEDDIPGACLSEPALLEEGLGEGCFEYKICNCEEKAHFVALCDLKVPHFFGDANLTSNVLSGLLFGSPFLKCLLHTRVKGLTLPSSNPNSSIQSCFLPRFDGKW